MLSTSFAGSSNRAVSLIDSQRRSDRRWWILLLLGTLALHGCEPRQQVFQHEALVFGSRAEFSWRAADAEQSEKALATVLQHLAKRERDWHVWQPSALTRANRACASGQWFTWPAALQVLYDAALPVWRDSDGLFNPAAGRLIAAWGFHHSPPAAGMQPSAQLLTKWRQKPVGMNDIAFKSDQARCLHPLLQWDFNAIAEGVASREIAGLLQHQGIEHALITLGGDVYALGQAKDRAWRVAIRHPEGGAFASIDLHDAEALFTSGSYARFVDSAAGTRLAHVLDPRLGEPVEGQRAVSVLHRDPAFADAAATALMAAPDADFERIARQLRVHCVLRMDDQGHLSVSTALNARLQWLMTPNAPITLIELGHDCH